MPDLTFLLDLPVAISRERVAQRDGADRDRMEQQDTAFYDRVRLGFLRLAQYAPRYRVFDATKPPEELIAQAMNEIASIAV